MTFTDCAREAEVVRLVASREGLAGAGADLRQHIETCSVCADVVRLASLLRQERDDALRDVHVPAAGQIWWRAALRAHAEASDAARRPLIWLQGIAAACAVALIAAAASAAWPWIAVMDAAPVIDALRPIVPVALTVLACLVVTPIVVYLALSDD